MWIKLQSIFQTFPLTNYHAALLMVVLHGNKGVRLPDTGRAIS